MEHANAQAANTSGRVLIMRQRALLENSVPMPSVELIRPIIVLDDLQAASPLIQQKSFRRASIALS